MQKKFCREPSIDQSSTLVLLFTGPSVVGGDPVDSLGDPW